MAFSSPIALDEFWDAIPLAQGAVFEPDEAMEVNRTGGGTVLTSSLGQRLWRGDVSFGLCSDAERRKAEAVLSRIRQSGMPFLCYDRKRPAPAADPDGTILGASVVQVRLSNASDLGSLTLKGLPANYQLTAGDLIGISYGADPVRHYLLQISEDIAASAAGNTSEFAITPFLPHAMPIDTAVTLIKPVMTAIYDPGSFAPGRGRQGGWESGRGFSFIQTLEY